MSHHKISTKEWEQFSNQISFSKQTVQELSKLYIIIHEKVKSSIKKSVLDQQKSFSSEAHHHIQFIKNILDKIKDTQSDQYLAHVQSDLLAKYQKNFLSLLTQIQIMLQVQQSQSNLNFASLKSIKPQKKQKHDLKSEVIESTKRITRAKSGYKNRKSQSDLNIDPMTARARDQNQIIDSFIVTNINNHTNAKNNKTGIQNQSDMEQAFEQKRQSIGTKIQNSMSKSSTGLGVSFQKKYESNYLEMYFNERKEFADLIFNQEVYNEIINKNQEQSKELNRSDSKSPSKFLKMQEVNTKLFPQFQIKTKFMKPAVKSKISNLITEIKKELLQLYYSQNVGTLKAVNEAQKEKLNQKKKAITTLNARSQSFSGFNRTNSLETIQQTYEKKRHFQNQIHKFSQTSYAANLNSSPPKISKVHSVHMLNKRQIFGPKVKKSFINPNPKPFYETDKWNQQIQKKYENRIMAKLLHAKI